LKAQGVIATSTRSELRSAALRDRPPATARSSARVPWNTLPDETAKVAFVADNPGNWMFHCHVVEHQENGMMGYLRVG
jgi:FtsP/CotA-like multicopper oxidase with cupredoxin domain